MEVVLTKRLIYFKKYSKYIELLLHEMGAFVLNLVQIKIT